MTVDETNRRIPMATAPLDKIFQWSETEIQIRLCDQLPGQNHNMRTTHRHRAYFTLYNWRALYRNYDQFQYYVLQAAGIQFTYVNCVKCC